MSKDTAIQYADSSLNLEMGCGGCELWSKTNRTCYAGIQTDYYAGRKGWPEAFNVPTIFPERMAKAESWSDLAGFSRDGTGKPWLNGMPRVIFLNDMGDTFDAKLPIDWLAPYLPRIAVTPHIYLLLTKRPSRMAEFSKTHSLPENVWPGTTVTSAKTITRVEMLHDVQGGGPKWVSVEPMWENLQFGDRLIGIGWVVLGGESRQHDAQDLHRLDLMWLAGGIKQARFYGAKPFVKQLGTEPYFSADSVAHDPSERIQAKIGIKLRDHHGANWAEWPEELRIREMPTVTLPPKTLSLL